MQGSPNEAESCWSPSVQARLLAQKQQLQKRLKLILQTSQIPRTSMDTMTVAEKIVGALDRIIEVG